jgi:hypothetical protein
MAVVQTGIFRQPQRLAYLLASSATWKTLCSVSTDADALKYIHVRLANEGDGSYAALRPRAICSVQDADHFSRRKTGRDAWSAEGTLTMSIELDIPGTYAAKSEDAHNWFMNQVGAIISELETNAGKGEPVTGETHLNVTSFNRVDGPWEYSEDEVEIVDPSLYTQKTTSWIVFSVTWNG